MRIENNNTHDNFFGKNPLILSNGYVVLIQYNILANLLIIC